VHPINLELFLRALSVSYKFQFGCVLSKFQVFPALTFDSTAMAFAKFVELPPELRLMVWDHHARIPYDHHLISEFL